MKTFTRLEALGEMLANPGKVMARRMLGEPQYEVCDRYRYSTGHGYQLAVGAQWADIDEGFLVSPTLSGKCVYFWLDEIETPKASDLEQRVKRLEETSALIEECNAKIESKLDKLRSDFTYYRTTQGEYLDGLIQGFNTRFRILESRK